MPFQNWHKKFDKFWPEHSKISKIFILMDSFWAKYIYILFELKRYIGIIFNETKEGYKIWRGIDVFFQNWHKKFDKFWPDHSKVSKILNSMDTFSEKYILSELKKVYYRGLILHESEKGYKISSRIDLSFQNWHKEFDKFWPKHLKVSKMFTLLGSCQAKYILFELKKNTETNVHETE